MRFAKRHVVIVLTVFAWGSFGALRAGDPSPPTSQTPMSIPTSQATTAATAAATQPRVDPAMRERVQRLVAQLGASSFAEREAAQRELAKLGEAAVPVLIPYIGSDDEEVAGRIAALVERPRDPSLRVDLAIALLKSTDPDWMERGVYLIFDAPRETGEMFLARTGHEVGSAKLVVEPVREQLLSWKQMEAVFQRSYARLLEKDPQRAESLRQMHEESNLYKAEAAYWTAVEALEEAQQGGRATSGPAGSSDR